MNRRRTEGAARFGRLSAAGVDRLIAGVVTVAQLLNPQAGPAQPQAESALLGLAVLVLALAQGIPLVLRRSRPVLVLLCVGIAWFTAHLFVTRAAPFGLWVALYSVIVFAPRRNAELASAVSIAGFIAVELARVYAGSARLQDVVPLIIGTLLVVLVGFVVADRRGRSAALRERAAFLERERDALSRQAVAEERLRIARELHDLVAHSLTTIAIQSSTGRLALPDHPEVALGALEAIEVSSRDATRELRQLLGVLREGEGSATGRLPSPGLGDLDSLLAAVRSAGVDLRVAADGVRSTLPQGIDLVAYRVVQEALTNVVKHAASAVVRLAIHRGDRELVIEVTDDGGDRAATRGETPGHGILGMRERVSSVGGSFDAGPLPGGGFRVMARLPLPEEFR